MRILMSLAAIATALFTPLAASADQITDELQRELSAAKTAADSLPVMCNLYDYMPRALSTPLGDRAIQVALRAKDYEVAGDLLRSQASRYIRNDSLLLALKETAKRFPESDIKRETITYIRMIRNMHRAYYSSSSDRRRNLLDFLKDVSTEKDRDIYDRIGVLHGLVMLMSTGPNGSLLTSYVDSLGVLVDQLPPNVNSIRRAYSLHAAAAYSSLCPEKAIASDRRTLKYLDKIINSYVKRGRIYKNMDATYYTIYCRLLMNASALSAPEAEEYYRKAREYAAKDASIEELYSSVNDPDIFYALYKKDYATGLALIKKCIGNIHDNPRRAMFLRFMITAGKALGDNATVRKASDEYISMLEQDFAERNEGILRELQISYAVNDMKHRYGDLEEQKAIAETKLQRTMFVMSALMLLVLFTLVFVLYNLNRRNRELAQKLTVANESLREESDNLRQSRAESIRAKNEAQKANNLKTEFIKNMSFEVKVPLEAVNEYSRLIADCVEESGKPQLARFADLVEQNSELLTTIIEDVLRLSEIESESMSVKKEVVNIARICKLGIDTMEKRAHKGVTMQFDPSGEGVQIYTDPRRLQQILNNLLSNAAKFTPRGTITVACRENLQARTVEISVTDTGIGIHPESKERIFERFVKLDRESQGAGLGLTIARLVARLLGGDVKLDTSYTDGSRFVVILPKN